MDDSSAGDVLGLLIGMIVPVVFVWQGVRMLIWPRQFLELHFGPFLETPPRRHFDGDGWASGLYWRITGGLAIVFGLVFFLVLLVALHGIMTGESAVGHEEAAAVSGRSGFLSLAVFRVSGRAAAGLAMLSAMNTRRRVVTKSMGG